jgi:two-component system, NarL family, sensor histidine kinase DevS
MLTTFTGANTGSKQSPARQLALVAVGCLLLATLATWCSVQAPWLGLSLRPSADNSRITITGASGPSAQLAGAVQRQVDLELREITSDTASVALRPADLLEEPDYLDEYAEMRQFFQRQTQIVQVLRGTNVALSVRSDGDIMRYAIVTGQRPLTSLPATFWFQLAAGSVGFLLAYWVLLLRPKDIAVRAFAALGAMILVFTFSAAIYSSRELAINGTWFRALSSINHAGATLFGAALVVLFWAFPAPLSATRLILVAPLLSALWWLADATHLAPNQNWGSRLPILLETVIAIGLATIQRVRARRDPRARAVLRTFGVAVLVGASLFVATTLGSSIFGGLPVIPQAYAFGFFLIMHTGLALGLSRHRLFDLSRGSLALFWWVTAAIGLVALDAGLAILFAGRRGLATAIAMLLCGLIYFPVRSWLWKRLMPQQGLAPDVAFARTLAVIFAPHATRQALWEAIVRDQFDALEVGAHALPRGEHADAVQVPTSREQLSEEQPTILSEGLSLYIPETVGTSAVYVHYPFKGQQLFGTVHVDVAASLRRALAHAESGRMAYERGIHHERERIARDLHDDVGARLLTGLYQDAIPALHQTLREAIGDMRSIVRELGGSLTTPSQLLEETRTECERRLEVSGCVLDWSDANAAQGEAELALVPEGVARTFRSIMRELMSNAIKHANATSLHVDLRLTQQELTGVVRDNGRGFHRPRESLNADASRDSGNGLLNLDRRAQSYGGKVSWTTSSAGTETKFTLPFDHVA